VQFTSKYRVPFPYRTLLPQSFRLGSIADETKGSKLKDLDGNWRYDLSGSYGVNVFGYDFYKGMYGTGHSANSATWPCTWHLIIRLLLKTCR